jgi:peroxiredoxin
MSPEEPGAVTVPAAIADLTVGAPAPDFTLPSTAGVEVALASFRGKRHVLLAFFPLAFTSTCTAENCAFSEDYARFERAETVVLPISVDSVPALKEYKTKYALRQDLLSDFKRDVSRAYGTLLADRFFSTRAYFLIDKQGILRWRHVEAELGARRDDAELLRQIGAL